MCCHHSTLTRRRRPIDLHTITDCDRITHSESDTDTDTDTDTALGQQGHYCVFHKS
jgi:hypothetical protein